MSDIQNIFQNNMKDIHVTSKEMLAKKANSNSSIENELKSINNRYYSFKNCFSLINMGSRGRSEEKQLFVHGDKRKDNQSDISLDFCKILNNKQDKKMDKLHRHNWQLFSSNLLNDRQSMSIFNKNIDIPNAKGNIFKNNTFSKFNNVASNERVFSHFNKVSSISFNADNAVSSLTNKIIKYNNSFDMAEKLFFEEENGNTKNKMLLSDKMDYKKAKAKNKNIKDNFVNIKKSNKKVQYVNNQTNYKQQINMREEKEGSVNADKQKSENNEIANLESENKLKMSKDKGEKSNLNSKKDKLLGSSFSNLDSIDKKVSFKNVDNVEQNSKIAKNLAEIKNNNANNVKKLKLKNTENLKKSEDESEAKFNNIAKINDSNLDAKTINNFDVEIKEPLNLLSKNWQPQLGQKLLMMSNQNIKQAHINVSPEELGNIYVKINIENEDISLVFKSEQQFTKKAIENSTEKLKDIFLEGGFNLKSVDVEIFQDQSRSFHENNNLIHPSYAQEQLNVEGNNLSLNSEKNMLIYGTDRIIDIHI